MAKRTAKTRLLRSDELSVFCLQLSMLLNAGVTPADGVGILLEEADSPYETALLSDLRDRLGIGAPFADALGGNGSFPDYMQRMVAIGETSGRLGQVLTALSSYYRREDERAAALRRVVAYPVVIVVMMACVLAVLMSQVLPVFQRVLGEMGVSLSPLAASLLSFGRVSEWLALAVVVVLVAVALLMLLAFRGSLGSKLGAGIRGLLARGKLGLAIGRGRFVSALSLMLSSGLRLDEAVRWTKALLEGEAIAPQIDRCLELIEAGEAFPAAVQKAGLFSGLQAGLLSVGFRSGASEAALEELSRRCEEETEARTDRLLSRVEPTLVIILAVAVGLILLSVMLPLVGMMSTIG